MMVNKENLSINIDGVSRVATIFLRLAFRWCGQISPSTATKAGVWLFTRPKRSPILPVESQLLTRANSYFLRYQGNDLAIMEWGAGPTILCVHGWSSRGLRFRTLIEQLVKLDFQVVAFDAPAHGRSSGSHIDVMGYADAILEIVQNLGRIYALAAHSYGAAASMLALERGLRIERAVFFSALNGIRGPIEYLGEKLGFSHETLRGVKAHFEGKFNRDIESLEAVHIVPRLDTPPLLIVHDQMDPLLPFHNALDLSRVWKNSRLLATQGIGHEAILDDPHVIETVLNFLSAEF